MGSNGAVLITTKRARKGYPYGLLHGGGAYKLSRMPDGIIWLRWKKLRRSINGIPSLELEKNMGIQQGFFILPWPTSSGQEKNKRPGN